MIDIESLNDIQFDFTKHEREYLSNLLFLNTMDEELIEDKRDKRLTVEYRNFLYNILKYRNLKLEDEGTVARRLIKANRYLDLKTLERDNYNIIRFSGIYLVSDVIFLRPDLYKEYFSNPAKYVTAESLGIPNNVCFRSMHLVTDHNNNSMTVALIKSDLSEKYLPEFSSWKFPIF